MTREEVQIKKRAVELKIDSILHVYNRIEGVHFNKTKPKVFRSLLGYIQQRLASIGNLIESMSYSPFEKNIDRTKSGI